MAKPFNVLVVDDDEDDLFLIRTAFEQDSTRYNLRLLYDGTNIINSFNDPRSLPDLVLLDLNMPVLNGFEILSNLKACHRHVPVVILTTSASETDIDRAYNLGANSFITKPSTYQELIDLAKQIRLYWFDLVQTPMRSRN